jgi:hypothetical protein
MCKLFFWLLVWLVWLVLRGLLGVMGADADDGNITNKEGTLSRWVDAGNTTT